MRLTDPDFQNYIKTVMTDGMEFTDSGFPKVKGVKFKDLTKAKLLGFNYCTSPQTMRAKGDHFVHFFLPDHYIERVWNNLDHYEGVFGAYKGIVQPDFSVYTDMPKVMQMWQGYRRNWVARYYQTKGITVIPAPTWGEEETFEWCFDGMPKRSCLAVSTVGCIQNVQNRGLLIKGLKEMLKQLEPSQLIIYGAITDPIRYEIHGVPYVHLESEQRVRMNQYKEDNNG